MFHPCDMSSATSRDARRARGAVRDRRRIIVAAVCAWALRVANAHADPQPMTLGQAISFALAHNPSVRTAHASERVASAQTDVARLDEWPRAGVSAEFLRGTGNVLPGTFFAVDGIPSVTGPPMTPPRFDGGAWGSALGVWAAWDVTDLVRRMVLVDAAIADERAARTSTDARRLEVAYQVADAFVAAIEAREIARAVEAAVNRSQVFATQVHALVDQQLRPGADASRADAEVARARIALSRAEQTVAVRDARLAEMLGVPAQHVLPIAGALTPASAARGMTAPHEHPLVASADAAVDAARLRERAVAFEYLPRVDLVAALWLRGSGYGTGSAANLGAAQGLVPDTPNWAAGIVVSWPVMEMFATRARVRVATARVEALVSRRTEIAQAIEGQIVAARAVLDGSLAVARNTNSSVTAARDSATQARARYQSGLATAVDVADAERVLADAEVEDATARLDVRRAMLLVSRAAGDLAPFLVEAGSGGR
jgi:outer membrane protein TolC